ncbi:hypothetical protein SLS53_006019 [Cytospora paraplurivora]|uniref:Uncharacterized protein n=1 Tax=Cytospora paraplurivora TaxID=2898453 RepID=A0AAN9U465_9PEZI
MGEFVIDTRKMRYTGKAMAALKESDVDVNLRAHDKCEDSVIPGEEDNSMPSNDSHGRVWLDTSRSKARSPQAGKGRHIGTYALTTEVAPWVKNALANYHPSSEVLELTEKFAVEFHDLVEKERSSSFDLHDLDAIELTYQCALEVGAAIILAADTTNDPVDSSSELHTSKAGGDDHFVSWGRLLTGLECDPPIIVQFPFYLMMCQSFTFEPASHREDYVYSALTGVDWVKGHNKFTDRIGAFEALARTSVPTLNDTESGEDRCFWRIALAYILAMNGCENSRPFKAPRQAAIEHGLDHDLVIAARALDTIGSAYMCRDGAAWLDDQGMDSLIGSALANDVMDLHTDTFTGETRNLLRLLYPAAEPLICGLKRAGTETQLPESPTNGFFHLWYDMVEDGSAQLAKKQPLGVSEDLAPVIRELHSLWHQQLLDDNKQPGWGRSFDCASDMLFSDAGKILASRGGISEDMYKFAIAYGRLSMSLPYIAYHTIDAIIMAFGVLHPASDSGGCLEILDLTYPLRADTSEFDSADASPLINFVRLARASWRRGGLDYQVTGKQAAGLKEIGFVDIKEETFRWPIGTWPENEWERKMGEMSQENVDHFLNLAGKPILLNDGFMTVEETEEAVHAAKEDLLRTDEKKFY